MWCVYKQWDCFVTPNLDSDVFTEKTYKSFILLVLPKTEGFVSNSYYKPFEVFIRTPYLKYFRMIFQVFINFMCLWVLETKHLTYLNEYLFLTKEKADSYTSICNASDIVKNIISISLVCFLKLKSSKKQTSIKCTTVSTVLWFY